MAFFDPADDVATTSGFFNPADDAPQKPVEGGFIPAAKQAIGSVIKGAGQLAGDLPFIDQDNALKRAGEGIINRNPTAVHGFDDAGDRPVTAVTEATGNAAGSIAGMLGVRAAGQAITAASPLAGPAAPIVAGVGQLVSWLGPAAIAALPSYGGIRDKQMLNNPENEESAKAKAVAALGAATVGVIESKFGPQQWALAAMTKEGRAKLAAKVVEGGILKTMATGALKGAAIEGAEELVQNPVEQVASFEDPTTKENLTDTAFSGMMGALGGGVLGGGVRGAEHLIRPSPKQRPPEEPSAQILGAEDVDQAISAFKFEVAGGERDFTQIRRAYKDSTPEENAADQAVLQKTFEASPDYAVDAEGQATFNGAPLRAIAPQELPLHTEGAEGLTRDAYEAIAAINQAQGKRTVVFEDDGKIGDGYANLAADPQVALISNKTSVDPAVVAAHEIQHLSETGGAQSVYAKIVEEELEGSARERAIARHGEMSEAKLMAEIRADLAGDAWADPTFHGRVLDKMALQLGEKQAEQSAVTLLDSIKNLIGRVKAVLTGTTFTSPDGQRLATQYVKNLERVHDALAAAIADKFIQQGYRPPGAKANTEAFAAKQAAFEAREAQIEAERTQLQIDSRRKAGAAEAEKSTQISLANEANPPAPTAVAKALERAKVAAAKKEFTDLRKAEETDVHNRRVSLIEGQMRDAEIRDLMQRGVSKQQATKDAEAKVVANRELINQAEARAKKLEAVAEKRGRGELLSQDEVFVEKLGPVKAPAGAAPAVTAAIAAVQKPGFLRDKLDERNIEDVKSGLQASRKKGTIVPEKGTKPAPKKNDGWMVIDGAAGGLTREAAQRNIDFTVKGNLVIRPSETWAGHEFRIVEDETNKGSFLIEARKKSDAPQASAKQQTAKQKLEAARAPTVNIGLNVGDKQGITPAQAKAALKAAGVSVLSSKVHQSDTEQTLVATLDRPLTEAEANQVSVSLQQEAIGQYAGGVGEIYGPKAADWRPFNPEYFLKLDGTRLPEPPPKRVSTRTPSAVKAKENHLTDVLVIGLDAMKADPAAFAKNVALVSKYPNFPKNVLTRSPEKRAEIFIAEVVKNLLWLHDRTPVSIRDRSKLWYDGANKIATRWAERYDLEPHQIAAAIAVLSPQKDWFQNVSLAERVLDALKTKGDFQWDDAMTRTTARIFAKPEYAGLVVEVQGRPLSALTNAQLKAMWVRAYDEAHNTGHFRTISPEGDMAGWSVNIDGKTRTNVAWGSLGEIGKAVSVAEDPSLVNISSRLGQMHKVRNFYNNILDPNSDLGDVTIDTHAVAAALLRPLSGGSAEVLHNFGSAGAATSSVYGAKGTYGLYAEAYRRAAAERGILPREMQSITWEAVRGLFTPGFKAQQKNVDAVESLWRKFRNGEASLNGTRTQILKLAGGVTNPEWSGPSGGADGVQGDSSYLGELPEFRVPRGRPQPAGRGAAGDGGGSSVAGGELSASPKQPGGRRGGRSLAEAQATAARAAEDEVGLVGAPVAPMQIAGDWYVPGPVAVARKAAKAYGERLFGEAYSPPTEYAKVDKERASRIANAFDEMVHQPENPEVKAAYRAMMDETLAQWEAIKATGLKVEFIDFEKTGDPYATTPRQAIQDVVDNNHLWVFPTTSGFGSDDTDISGNPLLELTDETIGGHQLRVNDVFRIVHDYFGHIKDGNGFRAEGEENAWRSHAAMYSPLARRAMTVETRGQNSWVNFGPYAEANKTASAADTHYAPQKIGLLPEWVSEVSSESTYQENVSEIDTNDDMLQASPKQRNDLLAARMRKIGIQTTDDFWRTWRNLMVGTAGPDPRISMIGSTDSHTKRVEDMLGFSRQSADAHGLRKELEKYGGVRGVREDGMIAAAIPKRIFEKAGITATMENAVAAYESLEESQGLQASPKFRIENLDHPGFYWNAKTKSFKSLLSGDYTTYATRERARAAAQRPDIRVYRLGVDEVNDTGPEGGLPSLLSGVDDDVQASPKTPEFKKWFGDSKVVDEKGEPLVVYHGTQASFGAFSEEEQGSTVYSGDVGFFFTNNTAEANAYAQFDWDKENPQPNVMPVYLSIKNPLRVDITNKAHPEIAPGVWYDKYGPNMSTYAIDSGYDGLIISDMSDDPVLTRGINETLYVAFKPNQIKSIFNDRPTSSADISASPKIVGASTRPYTPAHERFFKNVGRTITVPTLSERIAVMRKDLGKKMAQGLVDQFAPLKELSPMAYMLARLSKGSVGAFEAMLHHGKVSIRGGAYDADRSGGFIDKVGIPLHGELEDFLWWVAANRADRLSAEDRERLFSRSDIAAGKSLADGTLSFDYTLANGQVTRKRTEAFADSLKKFEAFNKNAMDMAEQSGLIDPAARKIWEHEFYVPFYRVSEEDGGFVGGKISNSLVRQRAFKKLKGGEGKLNSDLLANTLANWAHLLDAGAKNRAAKSALDAAVNMGVAVEADAATVKAMGRSVGKSNSTVWFMDGGLERHFLVDDPFVLTAITSLEYSGMKGPIMDAMATFKHVLTVGVTASPAFKIRNLIRDSVQAIATAPLGYNPLTNVKEGFAASNHSTQTYVSALASGGLIRFGTMLEGKTSDRVRQLVKSGIKDTTILNSNSKMQAMYDLYIEPAVAAYNELGNRSEEITRSALYKQLTDKGMDHAQAALMARDLMDFSLQGSWTGIRFLTQVVPFMNARMQGLYKLGRGAKDDPKRFAAVLAATALFSVSLLAAYHDDDDWKKREEWDRDNFWWFKVAGVAFRVPKPFEIGAVATMAERGLEYFTDPEMTGARLGERGLSLLSHNLSMNPVPQAFKPIIDLYANKNSFTGRPIETMGMENLQPDYRFTSRTSMLARAAGTAGQSVTSLVGANFLSPVQIDHALQAYFGWLGSFVVGASEVIARPMTSEPTQPSGDPWKFATQGFITSLPADQSKYVSRMYEQATAIEQAYGTYRSLLKQGRGEEAKEFLDDNRDKLAKYRNVSQVKSAEAKLNERIRLIERSNIAPEDKRARIAAINVEKDRVARLVK